MGQINYTALGCNIPPFIHTCTLYSGGRQPVSPLPLNSMLFILDGGAVPPSEWRHRGWCMLKQRPRSLWSPNGNRCSQCRLCKAERNLLRHKLRHCCAYTSCHCSGSPSPSMLVVVKSSAGNRCSPCRFRNKPTDLLRHTFRRSYTHMSRHCSAGRPSPMSMSMDH